MSGDNFGYDGIAVDPQNTNAIIVTSFDRYSGPDTMWKTTNASAGTPAWFQFFDPSSAQNSGYGGFNTTRNTSARRGSPRSVTASATGPRRSRSIRSARPT